jgi:hypothetical protein
MGCDWPKRAALRRLTACLVAVATSGISVAHGTENKDLVCAKPSALSDAEKQQRKLDNYTETSPDDTKTCSGCRSFHPWSGSYSLRPVRNIRRSCQSEGQVR